MEQIYTKIQLQHLHSILLFKFILEIGWADEVYNVYGIIEAVLEFGSVEELMAYADDPLLLLEL